MEADKTFEFPPWCYYLFGLIYLLSSLGGALVNGMNTYVVIKKKKNLLKTSTDIYLMFLSISNLVMALMGTPLAVISSFEKRWAFGVGGCTYYGFVVCLNSYTIISLLIAIAVDRYIVMVKTNYKHKPTTVTPWLVTLGCIAHSFLLALAPILGWSSYTLEGMQTHCCIKWQSKDTVDISFSLWLFFEMWFLPLGVITWCYVSITRKMKSQSPKVRCEFDKASADALKIARKREAAISKTSLIIILAFIVSWMPYAIVSAWTAFGDPNQIHPVLAAIPAAFVKIAMVHTPFAYMFRNKLFREEFFKEYPFFLKFSTKRKECIPFNCLQNSKNKDLLIKREITLLQSGKHILGNAVQILYNVRKFKTTTVCINLREL